MLQSALELVCDPIRKCSAQVIQTINFMPVRFVLDTKNVIKPQNIDACFGLHFSCVELSANRNYIIIIIPG